MKYRREHLPSGNVFVGDFTEAQHYVFEFGSLHPLRAQRRVAYELINGWNRQHPETWKYEVVNEPA